MNLYLFDLDGTISDRDSMIEFFLFINHKKSFFIKSIQSIPYLFMYFIGLKNTGFTKSRIIKIFLGSHTKAELEDLSYKFTKHFNKFIKPSAKDFINEVSSDEANEVFIVTASLEIWALPIAKSLNVKIIATKAKFKENFFSDIDGKNCNGLEKVMRIKQTVNLKDFKEIYAFGDSSGDKEMLKIANRKFYKFFG